MSKNQMILNVLSIYCFFAGLLIPFVFNIDFSDYTVLHLLLFLVFSMLFGNFFKKITIKEGKKSQKEMHIQDFKWAGFFYLTQFYYFVIIPASIGIFFIGAFLIL